MPAHITVLYPFRPPELIDGEAMRTLRRFFAGLALIRFELTEIRRFGDETLYLAPDPGEPFRQLTLGVWHRFPDTPPYGGQWPDIVPHLSIAHAGAGADLNKVAAEMMRELDRRPRLRARADAVTLIENTAGVWRILERFRLGPYQKTRLLGGF